MCVCVCVGRKEGRKGGRVRGREEEEKKRQVESSESIIVNTFALCRHIKSRFNKLKRL